MPRHLYERESMDPATEGLHAMAAPDCIVHDDKSSPGQQIESNR